MLVVTAIFENDSDNKPYGIMANNLRESVVRLGYDFRKYVLKDDPNVEESKNYYRLDCSFKVDVIRDALNEYPDKDVIWLDADCLMRSRVDGVLDDCDVAVTLRRLEARNGLTNPEYDGYINAVVLFFKNNEKSRKFLTMVAEHFKHCFRRTDQEAFNRVLLKYSKMERYGEVVDVSGCRVKILSTDDYNFFHFSDGNYRNAKILHIKGIHNREQYQKYVDIVLKEENGNN